MSPGRHFSNSSKTPARKASAPVLSASVPKPLRIIKRASRKFSFQQLRPETAQFSISQPQLDDPRHISISSSASSVSTADPHVGGNSSLTFLPTPDPSDAENESEDTVIQAGTPYSATDDQAPLIKNPSQGSRLNAAKYRIKKKVSDLHATTNHAALNKCALCKSVLKSALKTYTFPRTAPSVIATVRSLYPQLEPKPLGEQLTSTNPARFLTQQAAPIPPPAWTSNPITLSEPPACKACLRELRELISLERRRARGCHRSLSPGLDMHLGMEIGGSRVGIAGGASSVGFSPHLYPPLYDDKYIVGPDVTNQNMVLAPDATGARRGGEDAVADDLLDQEIRKKIRHVSSTGRVGRRGAATETRVNAKSGFVGPGAGFGTRKHPPLPKWMDKLPGRRGASNVGVSDTRANPGTRPGEWDANGIGMNSFSKGANILPKTTARIERVSEIDAGIAY